MGNISPGEFKVKPREISEEENSKYREVFNEDHPDYFSKELESLYKSDTNTEVLKEETPGAVELGNTFLVEPVEKYPKHEYKKSIATELRNKKFNFGKRDVKLVRNDILGYVHQDIIDEALRRGAITKKEFMGNIYWCIPAVEVIIGEEGGKVLAHPKKTWRVSEKYFQFREDLKQGKIKINNTLI